MRVSPGAGLAGLMATDEIDGAVLTTVTVLEVRLLPLSVPSEGVTTTETVWSRSK